MKNNYRYRSQRGGWLLIEAGISLGVLGILMMGFWAFQSHLGTFNRQSLALQHCQAAAQAQLESLAVTGQPIDPERLEEVWPGVETVFTQTPGEGDWAGLTLLNVQASTTLGERELTAACVRYVLLREVQP